MLKRAYFDAHHRHKWQCFRIRLVDKKKATEVAHFKMVREKRLELLHTRRQNLNLVRLPISPLPRTGFML